MSITIQNPVRPCIPLHRNLSKKEQNKSREKKRNENRTQSRIFFLPKVSADLKGLSAWDIVPCVSLTSTKFFFSSRAHMKTKTKQKVSRLSQRHSNQENVRNSLSAHTHSQAVEHVTPNSCKQIICIFCFFCFFHSSQAALSVCQQLV